MSWYAIYYKNQEKKLKINKDVSWTRVEVKNVEIGYCFKDRFHNDKIFAENNKSDILLDGIILNKKELIQSGNFSNLEEYLKSYLQGKNRSIPASVLRGPFSGIVYDKEKNEMCIFGNQTGDGMVFYYETASFLLASSDFNFMIKVCRDNSLHRSLNRVAVDHILSLGYMVEENTIVSEVKRVFPGKYIRINPKETQVCVYHRFMHNFKDCSMDDAVEMVDEAFKKAVVRSMEKDIEYGIENHLVNMSGGLDCRMISFAADKMGYRNITNNCYAKYGSKEVNCAASAARSLGNDFIYMPLDNINYVYDVDQVVEALYGLTFYTASSGCNRMLSNLNFQKFGLENTGLLGDVIIGSYLNDIRDDAKIDISSLAFSHNAVPFIKNTAEFDSQDIFALYYRGFQGMVVSVLVRDQYTDSVSPFLDVDFIETCLSIPLEYRVGHKLYWKWLYEKYPNVTEIETTTLNPYKKDFSLKGIARKILGSSVPKVKEWLKNAGLLYTVRGSNYMNPQDLLLKQNPKAGEFMKDYYMTNIELLGDDMDLINKLEKCFEGDAREKQMVMTILAAFKIFLM